MVGAWTSSPQALKQNLGGPVVKNSLANAEDMGVISGLGRFHMPQLSLHAATTEPTLQSMCFATKEAAAVRSPHTTARE